jgi:hypothetical protein
MRSVFRPLKVGTAIKPMFRNLMREVLKLTQLIPDQKVTEIQGDHSKEICDSGIQSVKSRQI